MSTQKKRKQKLTQKRKRKQAPLQCDGYRAVFRRVEQPPKSWRQMVAKVNAEVIRTLANLIGLVADVTDSARKIVRAAPRLFSRKLVVTVGAAHLEADAVEGCKQEESDSPTFTQPDADAVAETLANVLGHLQAQGIHVNVTNENGRLIVVAARPELAEVALDTAKQQVGKPKASRVGKKRRKTAP